MNVIGTNEYRILVTGSRDWIDVDIVETALWVEFQRAILQWNVPVVVHGACPTGADLIAHNFAKKVGAKTEPHPADWNKHGRAAGPIRNDEMVALGAEVCLAFPLRASRGTRHCMNSAHSAGIAVIDLSFLAD